jgi:hypothetical protein
MTLTIASTTSRELRGNFVLLRADTLRLLLPQSDVGVATYLDQVPQATDLPGLFEHRGEAGEQAVLALSAHMVPLAQYPKDRFLVTPITTPLGDIGFCWSEVSVLIDTRLQPQALPTALVAAHAPLKEFVEIDDHVVFCCDAEHVAEYALANRA